MISVEGTIAVVNVLEQGKVTSSWYLFSSPRLHIIVSGKRVRIHVYKHQAGSIVCVDTVDSIII